jgi:chloramphenicol-sensitive protein RarD
VSAAPGAANRSRLGVVYALLAYGSWGLIPLYWKALAHVAPAHVVAHRGLWSLPVLGLLLLRGAGLGSVVRALGDRRHLRLLLVSGGLLACNWGLFIWAVSNGRVLESSLGYYINPLVNVLLGVLVLGERLRPLQAWAVGLATLAVVYLGCALGTPPWVALGLAVSFSLYGLLRKRAGVEALPGLAAETLLFAPLALGYLVVEGVAGRGAFPAPDASTSLLLVGSGLVSCIPLLWFSHAARRLDYTTLGQLQYLTPTGHLLLGWLVYGESLSTPRVVTFALIAVALVVYATDAWRHARARRVAAPAPG